MNDAARGVLSLAGAVAAILLVALLGEAWPTWASMLLVAAGALLPALGLYLWRRPRARYPMMLLGVLFLAGCAIAAAGKPGYQSDMERVSNDIAQKLAIDAVPYPTSAVTDSLERRMLRERLLRFNHASKIGYVYVFNQGSPRPIGYYVIRGKVSSTASQLTNPDQSFSCGDACEFSVQSIEDDGSWGSEEGGQNGVFFFTASGVMAEITPPLGIFYSDAPVPLWQNVPQLQSSGAQPSSTSTFWQQSGGLGGG